MVSKSLILLRTAHSISLAFFLCTDHSKDAEFKKQVQMTLEWHLLNMAPEWLNGYFISSSLREYYFACSPHMMSPYPLLGWLFFGGGPNPILEQKV